MTICNRCGDEIPGYLGDLVSKFLKTLSEEELEAYEAAIGKTARSYAQAAPLLQ